MHNQLKKSGIIAILLLSVLITQAQQKNSYKWMLGINGGAMIYQGDLSPSPVGSYKTPGSTWGIQVSKILSPFFAARGSIVMGRLKGNDAAYSNPAWRKYRALNFTSPVKEFTAQMIWNPFGNNSNEVGLRVTPYLFAGAGLSFLNVARDYSRLDTLVFSFGPKMQDALKDDIAVTPPGVLLVLPLGIGFSFYLSPRWSVTAETNFRYSFSDYTDGFSKVANPGKKDFYHSHTIGLVYKFGGGGSSFDCPKY